MVFVPQWGMRFDAYLYTLAALLGLLGASCSHGSAPNVLPSGHWGGDHVSLDVTATSTRIEFDCAHGTVDGPWPLDGGGNFDISGQYIQEHPGPVIEGQPEDSQPAQYSGHLDGTTVSFTAHLQDGTSIGPYQAVEGQQGRVFKCL